MPAGVDASISRKAVVNVLYGLSTAINTIQTRALGNPRLPNFLPTKAENYTDTNNRWHRAVASIKFPLKKGVTPGFEYRYEKYDRMDFQMANAGRHFPIDPSAAAAVFLRRDVPGYHAHCVTASLEYRFQL